VNDSLHFSAGLGYHGGYLVFSLRGIPDGRTIIYIDINYHLPFSTPSIKSTRSHSQRISELVLAAEKKKHFNINLGSP
jgi:hypothetical protein